jgi:predicted ATPase with chaperone activity
MQTREWLDQGLLVQVQIEQAQDQTVQQLDQVVKDQVVPVALVQDLVLQNLDLAGELPEDFLEDQELVVADAESVAELQERLVKAALADRARQENPNAQNVKSSNKEVSQALVEQLFHAVMAQQLFGYVAVLQSKTSQTRLMQMPVS